MVPELGVCTWTASKLKQPNGGAAARGGRGAGAPGPPSCCRHPAVSLGSWELGSRCCGWERLVLRPGSWRRPQAGREVVLRRPRPLPRDALPVNPRRVGLRVCRKTTGQGMRLSATGTNVTEQTGSAAGGVSRSWTRPPTVSALLRCGVSTGHGAALSPPPQEQRRGAARALGLGVTCQVSGWPECEGHLAPSP